MQRTQTRWDIFPRNYFQMSRPFRPFAKIPVKISFKSYDRPKKVVWDRGYVKIVDNGECVELSSYFKDHANFPIERLYKNKLRGNDVQPYIFSIRLDVNHPENEGQKLICLNFNGNREGYEHALNSINNAFEAFSHRFNNQAKKLPGPEKEEKTLENNKKKRNEVQLNTEKKKEQGRSSRVEKVANFAESLQAPISLLPHSRSAVSLQLLQAPPPKPGSWISEFDRLLGGPEKVSSPKVNDPQEEERLAEIRRSNDLKLEQRRKERAEKRKEKAAEKPIQEVVSEKKKIVEDGIIHAEKPAENDSSVKKLEDPESARKPLRTVLYDFGNERNSPNTFSELEVSLSPNQKSSRIHPVDVRKRLALRQGSVVKKSRKDSEQTSRKVANRSERTSSSSLKASSSKPAKRAHREFSPSQESFDEWPARLRGFSPNVSPNVSPYQSPKKSSNSKRLKLHKHEKNEKPKRRLIISSESELSDDEPTNKYKDAPRAKAHEMDLDFEAPSSMDPPSRETSEETSGETSGYSTGNQSSSTSVLGDSQPLQDIKLEPIDEEGVYNQSSIATQSVLSNQLGIPRPIEQKTPEQIDDIHRGQQYTGMTFTHTTIINSRLVDCDVQNSTIVNCVIENSSISNSRVTSQTI